MPDNLVVRISNPLEKREVLCRWMLGIRDLALKGNGRACSTRARLCEHAPAGNRMALISAELTAQPGERLRPLVLCGFCEKLRAVI